MNKDQIEQLYLARSETGGTSLDTLYIVPNSSLTLATNQLNSELSTSQNIKDKSVRKSVQIALRSGIDLIRDYGHHAPENGLVLLTGLTNSYI
jgi:peptide subunit release factor 1 (eRF1)